MVHAKQTTRFRFWLWLIRLIGVIVPQRLRADWQQEWEAELHHRELLLAEWDRLEWRSKLDLLRRSSSAFLDALWLQPRRWEDEMIQDVRYGIRMLLKRPAFTSIAVMTLALGIGANLTIFSFVDTMFFRPLPASDPYRLVNVNSAHAYPAYKHFRDQSKSFEELAAHYSTAPLDVGNDVDSEMLNGAVVSANYFSTLGLNPSFGRFFLPEEDAVPDRDRVVVISHQMWQTRFSGDSTVVEKSIRINGSDFRIIGVAPKGFEGVSPGYPNDMWIPTMMLRVGYRWCDALTDLSCRPLGSIGRLKLETTLDQAQAELATISSRLAADSGKKDPGVKVSPALGVREMDRESLSYQFRLMMMMTGLLLLIACANVAGLLLTHSAARRKEIAVRLGIGAGRARLIRQFLTESLMLTLIGGAVGLLVSHWAKNLLMISYATASTFRIHYDLSLNPRTLTYAFVITIASGLIFGLVPAIQSTRHNLVRALKDESGTQSRHQTKGRNAMVIIQVALSLALLISAGLLVRSVSYLRQGKNFDPQQVVSIRLRPGLLRYQPEKAQAFTKEVVRRIEALPGVESVSVSRVNMAWPGSDDVRIRLPEQVTSQPEDQLKVVCHEVGSRLFETLKMPLVQGREFNDGDRPGGSRVVVVNEILARQMWPDGSSLGRILFVNDQPYQVIGVAKDTQFLNANQVPAPFLYLAYWQNNLRQQVDSHIVVRVAGDPQTMVPIIRREVRSLDPNVPINGPETMMQSVDAHYKQVLLTSKVLTASSAIALFLSMIGLYGTLSFAVRQRTREIGVRMALGAQAADVLKLFVVHGLRLVFVGLAIGLLAAFAATRLMNSLLYGVSPTDPITFVLVALLLTLVAFAACWIPARRATKVDPLVALRHE